MNTITFSMKYDVQLIIDSNTEIRESDTHCQIIGSIWKWRQQMTYLDEL